MFIKYYDSRIILSIIMQDKKGEISKYMKTIFIYIYPTHRSFVDCHVSDNNIIR